MLTTLTLLDLLLIVFVTSTTALLFYVFSHSGKPTTEPTRDTTPAQAKHDTMQFDFDPDGDLIYRTESAAHFLDSLELDAPSWAQFRSRMISRFPDLPQQIAPSQETRIVACKPHSIADQSLIELERHPTGFSVRVSDYTHAPQKDIAQLHQVLSSLRDLDLIKAVSEQAPFPVWHSLADGSVGWSNAHYQSLESLILHESRAAFAPLFELPEFSAETSTAIRASVKDKARNRTYWFDVTRQSFGDGCLNYAIDIHAVVNAESAQRNFVQTLAKTFAHLATGLAIFDRNRQLVLFNPALIDLTELRADFLTGRPNLFSFFDQLRNNQIMPEPKSYATWRERIAEVVSAASDDKFNETWHLPNGLTYRVTGRPHPDGAIAFLIEDISAEISLTRRFRAQADITRSAMDAIEDGLAIFDSAGFVSTANAAMLRFLDLTDEQKLQNMTFRDLSRSWQEKCKPSPVLGDIRDFISGTTEREAWTAKLSPIAGGEFTVQISPLSGGASMVCFKLNETLEAPSTKTQRSKKKDAANTIAA